MWFFEPADRGVQLVHLLARAAANVLQIRQVVHELAAAQDRDERYVTSSGQFMGDAIYEVGTDLGGVTIIDITRRETFERGASHEDLQDAEERWENRIKRSEQAAKSRAGNSAGPPYRGKLIHAAQRRLRSAVVALE